jgi:hypothetical protein
MNTVFTAVLAIALVLQDAVSRTVLATVTGPLKQSIVDLGPDDFVVRESDQPREVLTVRIADYPVIVLIDDSQEGARDFETARAAAARFVTRLGQRPVAIGTLADPPALVASFEDERPIVLRKLADIRPRAAAGNLLLQGVANAAALVRSSETPFAAVVVISAGTADGTPASQHELLGPIVESRAMVHVIARRDSGRPPAPELLRDLAEQTHGQFTTVFASASYQIALDHLADEMATEMMIEYLTPQNGAPSSDVKVGVTLAGARVTGLGVR